MLSRAKDPGRYDGPGLPGVARSPGFQTQSRVAGRSRGRGKGIMIPYAAIYRRPHGTRAGGGPDLALVGIGAGAVAWNRTAIDHGQGQSALDDRGRRHRRPRVGLLRGLAAEKGYAANRPLQGEPSPRRPRLAGTSIRLRRFRDWPGALGGSTACWRRWVFSPARAGRLAVRQTWM